MEVSSGTVEQYIGVVLLQFSYWISVDISGEDLQICHGPSVASEACTVTGGLANRERANVHVMTLMQEETGIEFITLHSLPIRTFGCNL